MPNKQAWIPVDKFVRTFVIWHRQGKTLQDVAKELGLGVSTVRRRAAGLRKRGVGLPDIAVESTRGLSMVDAAKAALEAALAEDIDDELF